jgi:diaminohydroxyphosphoribosylaminopyrimidine deaminase/5-amino-6-(5-phosphoribosylamino)uracil reductase
MEEEAFRTNEIFFKYAQTRLPFVALKAAVSMDGKIATRTGESRWITGERARQHGHILRNTYDAVLVGIGTVKKDNPCLTCRIPNRKARNPIRIVVDSNLSIDYDAQVLNTDINATTIVATTNQAPLPKVQQIQKKAKVLAINKGLQVDLVALLERLGEMEITSILVEGGSRINWSFLAANLVDKYYCYIAPIIIGGDEAPGTFGGEGTTLLTGAFKLFDLSVKHLGEDLLVTGYLKKQHYRRSISDSMNP